MHASAFNIYVENFPEPGSTLVHNTFSGAYAVVDATTGAALHKAARGEPLDDEEEALLAVAELTDANVAIAVASREEEEREFRAWFERRRDRKILDVLVSVNLACNFDCPYCVQAKIMSGKVMPTAIADETAGWIAARARQSGVQAVEMVFVGGEPLLHPERIKRISRGVRDACDLPVTFKVITNGYFLDDEMVTELCEVGLVEAKVTLDGDETTHARTRVCKNGEDTFQRIFDHVIAASRRIRIYMNGNYQENTLEGFAPLIAKLAGAGLPQGSQVRLSPALSVLSAPEGAHCTWIDRDMPLQIAFHDELLRRGFETAPLHVVGPCQFHDRDSFAIDPEGRIYKCPGFLGHPGWAIGHVRDGLIADRYRDMMSATPQDHCDGCRHRPNCGGGCVAHAWIERGAIGGVTCWEPYLEQVAQDGVVRGYLLATSPNHSEAVARFPKGDLPLESKDSSKEAAIKRGRRSIGLRVVAA